MKQYDELSLSLSYTHTHTHTHIYVQCNILKYICVIDSLLTASNVLEEQTNKSDDSHICEVIRLIHMHAQIHLNMCMYVWMYECMYVCIGPI